jgi:hypothetical protein
MREGDTSFEELCHASNIIQKYVKCCSMKEMLTIIEQYPESYIFLTVGILFE